MPKPWRSKVYRDAGKGKPCTVCLQRPTECGCHIRLAPFCGTQQKPPDFMIFDGCTPCHDQVDGRSKPSLQGDYELILRALCRTIQRRIEDGVLTLNGE